MTRQEAVVALAELMELEPGELTLETELADLAGWDSMMVLGFIAFADSELGVVPRAQVIIQCATINDLLDLVAEGLEG